MRERVSFGHKTMLEFLAAIHNELHLKEEIFSFFQQRENSLLFKKKKYPKKREAGGQSKKDINQEAEEIVPIYVRMSVTYPNVSFVNYFKVCLSLSKSLFFTSSGIGNNSTPMKKGRQNFPTASFLHSTISAIALSLISYPFFLHTILLLRDKCYIVSVNLMMWNNLTG